MESTRKTQAQRIVAELKRAGSRGRTSLELSRISLNYTGRVSDLRHEGWTIKAERQENGWFRYRLGAQDL